MSPETRTTGMMFAAVLVVVAAAWLCLALFPGPLPTPRHPDFVDNIFDSRAVIWAARLLLVSAAFVLAVGGVFIVASTAIRMRNGDWLRRAGPFEVSETAASELRDQVVLWRSATLDAHEEIEELKSRLARSAALIDRLTPARSHF
jgi:hypothetical protein